MTPEQIAAIPQAMRDKFRFVVTDAAEAIVIHEALMSMRNREQDWPTDVLRAEAADRVLAHLDSAISQLAVIRKSVGASMCDRSADPSQHEGAPMTPEQIAAKGAFVRVLREYADKANDNFSQKVAVPEHVLRDAAAAIEDQRAHIDTLTAAMEAEWYNGNLDEKAYRRLCKIVGNEPYPSAILNGETP